MLTLLNIIFILLAVGAWILAQEELRLVREKHSAAKKLLESALQIMDQLDSRVERAEVVVASARSIRELQQHLVNLRSIAIRLVESASKLEDRCR